MINIKGLDKAEVLKALYDEAIPQGLGFIVANHMPIPIEECRELLKKREYFDYLHGRPLKIDLSTTNVLDPRLYDRDQGEGAAEAIIEKLRARK